FIRVADEFLDAIVDAERRIQRAAGKFEQRAGDVRVELLERAVEDCRGGAEDVGDRVRRHRIRARKDIQRGLEYAVGGRDCGLVLGQRRETGRSSKVL